MCFLVYVYVFLFGMNCPEFFDSGLPQVNPDEVVAMGAAVQAGVLAGEVKDEDGQSSTHSNLELSKGSRLH